MKCDYRKLGNRTTLAADGDGSSRADRTGVKKKCDYCPIAKRASIRKNAIANQSKRGPIWGKCDYRPSAKRTYMRKKCEYRSCAKRTSTGKKGGR